MFFNFVDLLQYEIHLTRITLKKYNINTMTILKKYITLFILLLIFSIHLNGQESKNGKKIKINGKLYSTMIVDGDTIILADLNPVSFSTIRNFESADEKKRYRLYKYYAPKVYPYAKDAINILNKIEERTKDMPSRKRKKYIKLTYRQLEYNFKKQLKKLSKTQGKILVKMIEKETDSTFYEIIRRMRNGAVAFTWHQFGKFWDYDLKQGYHPGDDRPMDTVLQDFNFNDNSDEILNAELLKKDNKTKSKK